MNKMADLLVSILQRYGQIAHKGRRYAVRASADRVAPPLVGDLTILFLKLLNRFSFDPPAMEEL
ncbi:MAG TPA: hypothetical protein VFB12_04190 [Ktedonobacteraceae bacterium]|nr:hypothetical protein [Ktedonobacteraceae bacterium]